VVLKNDVGASRLEQFAKDFGVLVNDADERHHVDDALESVFGVGLDVTQRKC